ncbi:hypothetical protein D3C78_1915920 [compost metagenome]
MAAIARTEVRRLRLLPVSRGVTRLSMITLMTIATSRSASAVPRPWMTRAMMTGGMKLSSMPKRGI